MLVSELIAKLSTLPADGRIVLLGFPDTNFFGEQLANDITKIDEIEEHNLEIGNNDIKLISRVFIIS